MQLKTVFTSILYLAALALASATVFAAADVSAYLILDDIPPYVRLTKARDIVTDQPKTIPGYTIYSSSGILAGADHFAGRAPQHEHGVRRNLRTGAARPPL